MAGLDRDTIWEFFLHLAEVAARETLPRFRAPLTIDNKDADGGFDPVTVADQATEAALRAAITARFPEHGIQGEEEADKRGSSVWSWIIDPIDGTRSFVSGMPTWGTLIGLLENGVPRYGMMSQPFTGDCFIGGAGQADLFSHGQRTRLTARRDRDLSSATLYATTPEMFTQGVELDAFNTLSRAVRLTRFGADCYGYCLLAAGYVDLVVEANLGFYDIAPLIPIIEAAGGIVTDWSGKPMRSGGRALAAASGAVHGAALAILGRAS